MATTEMIKDEFVGKFRKITCKGASLEQEDVDAIRNALRVAAGVFRDHVREFKAAEIVSQRMEAANARTKAQGKTPRKIPFITSEACSRLAQQFEDQIKETETVLAKLESASLLIAAEDMY